MFFIAKDDYLCLYLPQRYTMTGIQETLKKFDPISLEEMDNVKLMNRADTKYLLNRDKLIPVMEQLSRYYRILEIAGKRTNDYKSLYFDTGDFKFYHDHHRGKMNRTKIRYRQYLDSGLWYLEVKLKNNKGKTEKERIKRKDQLEQTGEAGFSDRSKKFIEEATHIPVSALDHKLTNYFTRLTLVHKIRKERLTIDLDLRFVNEGANVSIPNLVIAELKQEKFSSQSDFAIIMKKEKIYPGGFSKYCIGSLLLNPHLKRNSFKPKLLKLNKLTHGNIAA